MPKFRLKVTIHKLDNVPLLSGGGYVRFKVRDTVVARRDSTPVRPLVDHSIEWNHVFDTKIKIGIESKDQVLKDQIICLDVFFVETANDSHRNEKSLSPHGAPIHHNNNHSSRKLLLGRVEINVAMFVNQPPDPCRYIMKRSRVNSILQVTTEVEFIKGEAEFNVPPLKNSLLFGSASLIAGSPEQRQSTASPTNCTSNNQLQPQHKVQTLKNSVPIATDICAQLYRSSLFTEWQLQQGELPAQLCVDDIFEGGHGWAGDGDDDKDKQQFQEQKKRQQQNKKQQQQQQEEAQQQTQRRHHKLGLTHHMPAKPNLDLGPLRISGFRHRKNDSAGSNTIGGQFYSSLSSANGSTTDTQLSDNTNIKRQSSLSKLRIKKSNPEISPVILCTTNGCGVNGNSSPSSPKARIFPSYAMKDSLHTPPTNNSFAEFRAGTTTENHAENGVDYNKTPRALEGLLNHRHSSSASSADESPIMSEANAESSRALNIAGISTDDLHLYKPWKPSHHHNSQSTNQLAWLEKVESNTRPVFGYQHRGVKYSTSKDGRLVLNDKNTTHHSIKTRGKNKNNNKKRRNSKRQHRHAGDKKDPYEKMAASAKISDEDDANDESVIPRHQLWTTFTNTTLDGGQEEDSGTSSSSISSSSSSSSGSESESESLNYEIDPHSKKPAHATSETTKEKSKNNKKYNKKSESPGQCDINAFDSEWATAERNEYLKPQLNDDDENENDGKGYQSDHDESESSDYEYFQDELRPNLQNWNINLEKLDKIDGGGGG